MLGALRNPESAHDMTAESTALQAERDEGSPELQAAVRR